MFSSEDYLFFVLLAFKLSSWYFLKIFEKIFVKIFILKVWSCLVLTSFTVIYWDMVFFVVSLLYFPS